MIATIVRGAAVLVVLAAVPVAAQPAAPAAPAPAFVPFVRNMTRVESWRFFEPPPGGGEPDYDYLGNRLQFGVRRERPRYDVLAALQYVQLAGLPRRAAGPGLFGVGANYFDHAGRTDSRQLYLRYLNVRLKNVLPGTSVLVGRMAYTSGAEASSGDARIESIKRQRLDSRMLGEFEWSFFQRSYDGIRVDWDRRRWHATGSVLRPTQGGFEDAAGLALDDVTAWSGTVNARPGALLPRSEVQVFGYRYEDDRAVRARPDNSGLAAGRVDARINSAGGSLVGSYPVPSGDADLLLWVVGQAGTWYGQPHRAYAVAIEGGHQWPRAPWRPWVRAGVARASGDADPADDRHGTFFQMLPTVRRYSLSATYALMNLNDVFVETWLRPAERLTVRLHGRRVSLAEAADRWYAGSGATQERGAAFGFAARPSRGAADLGAVLESSADFAINRHWSVNGYAGWIRGGDVVGRSFAGRDLTFAYIENLLQF